MSLNVVKISPDSFLPIRATPGAAGYDLHSSEGHVILPGHRATVSTGIKIQLPDGVYGRIAPRSGLAVRHGIQVGAGVIDSDYRGEVKIVLFNHDQDNAFVVKPGSRVAQLILEQCVTTADVVEVQAFDDDTTRGGNGFGSTGTTDTPPPTTMPEV